jgi:predicted nucleic acid-binding protein
MQSLDTNILLAAMERSNRYHAKAYPLYEALMNEPDGWILADQTLFELYRLLRNPAVVARPMSGRDAVDQIEFLRNRTRARHCAFESKDFPRVLAILRKLPQRLGILVFDAVLAVTLNSNGVTRFFTRNKVDFEAFDIFEVEDPLT